MKTKEAGQVQAQKTRKLIADALLDLLEERSFSQITVTQICDRAGICRQTWYRNYHTKEDALCAVMEETLENYQKAFPFTEDLQKNVTDLFLHMPFSKTFLRCIEEQHLGSLVFQALGASIRSSMQRSAFRHLLDNPAYDAYLKDFIAGTILSILMTWARDGFKESREELAGIAGRLLVI